jgi:tetratricopeptide (TPR) repeat protein
MTGQTLQPLDAIKPAAASNAPNDPARAEYEAGKKALAAGNYGEAAVSLHNALVSFQEKNDQPGTANASNQLGLLCLARKDYATASSHFETALAICEEVGDQASVAAIRRSLVESLSGERLFPQAVDHCLDLLDLYAANNDPQNSVMVLEMLAEVYIASGETDRAADTLRTAASIHRNFRHQSMADDFLRRADALEQGGQGRQD